MLDSSKTKASPDNHWEGLLMQGYHGLVDWNNLQHRPTHPGCECRWQFMWHLLETGVTRGRHWTRPGCGIYYQRSHTRRGYEPHTYASRWDKLVTNYRISEEAICSTKEFCTRQAAPSELLIHCFMWGAHSFCSLSLMKMALIALPWMSVTELTQSSE